MSTGTCRSCGAAILWIESAASSKPMPLDPEPRADGNIFVLDGRGAVETMLTNFGEGPRYVTHFVSCPSAAQHRKPRQPRP